MKTKVTTFGPGKILISLSGTAYCARMDENFRDNIKGRMVECGECDKMLAIGWLAGHLAKQHDIYQSFVMEEEWDGSSPPSPCRWEALFLPAEGCHRCPVSVYSQRRDGSSMKDSWKVRWHFSYRRRGHHVAMAVECYHTKCRLCGNSPP